MSKKEKYIIIDNTVIEDIINKKGEEYFDKIKKERFVKKLVKEHIGELKNTIKDLHSNENIIYDESIINITQVSLIKKYLKDAYEDSVNDFDKVEARDQFFCTIYSKNIIRETIAIKLLEISEKIEKTFSFIE